MDKKPYKMFFINLITFLLVINPSSVCVLSNNKTENSLDLIKSINEAAKKKDNNIFPR